MRSLDQEGEEWEDLTGTGQWVDSEGEWVEAMGEEGEEGEFVFETELGDGRKIAISPTKPYVGEEILLDDDDWWRPDDEMRETGVVDFDALRIHAR